MDFVDAPLRAHGRLALVGGSERVAGALAFDVAKRAAARDATASVLLVGRRRGDADAPPVPVVAGDALPPDGLGGHGECASLDRVRMKHVESASDVAWLLNSARRPGGVSKPLALLRPSR